MKKLSIIIPVHNEARTIEELLRRVDRVALPGGLQKEIIVIDDASMDRTPEILRMHEGKIRVLRHAANKGKGAGVAAGLAASTGDFAVIQDGDLEYDPNEYADLLAPILAGTADVVYGSRLLTSKPHRVMYFYHYLGNKFLTLFSNLFTNLNLTDMETCYKMFTRKVIDDIAPKLISARFGIEPELTARIKRYRVYEVGISYAGRTYREGKHINWKDGLAALWHIVKFNMIG